jgi:hypothetical protein
MNIVKLIGVTFLVGMIFLSGCAPSVTVTEAGSSEQFEITVSSNDFTDDSEELIDAWHKEARNTCGGNNYKVITRDIIHKEEPFSEFVITGIVECQ